jgi:hypothetical protein
VIDAKRDGSASDGFDHLRGFVDRLWPSIRRRLAFDASTGAVDSRTGFPERSSNATAGAPRRPRDEGHASSQRLAEGSLLCHVLDACCDKLNGYLVLCQERDEFATP